MIIVVTMALNTPVIEPVRVMMHSNVPYFERILLTHSQPREIEWNQAHGDAITTEQNIDEAAQTNGNPTPTKCLIYQTRDGAEAIMNEFVCFERINDQMHIWVECVSCMLNHEYEEILDQATIENGMTNGKHPHD